MIGPSSSAKRQKHFPAIAVVAFLIVVVVAALSYMALSNGSVTAISGATTLSITKSASAFRVGGSTYAMALASANPSSGVAHVYLNRLPAFMNPLLNITTYTGQETKVNAGTSFANIELQVVSLSNDSVTLTITPISTDLEIAPDSSYISTVRTSLQSFSAGTGGASSTQNTTNKATTSTSTTTVATTTVSTNSTQSTIMAVLQKSIFYPLMMNYSRIYANTRNCTSAMYNSTYFNIRGTEPSGYSTFQNVSQFVPYSLYNKTTSSGSGVYSVIYYTKTRYAQYNNTPALTIRINVSEQSIVGSAFGGVFMGLNYTQVYDGYESVKGVGGACEAYMS
jgi:hypothetical protein